MGTNEEAQAASALAGTAILGLAIGWAREICEAVKPLRKLHGMEEELTEEDFRQVGWVLITVLQAMTLNQTSQLFGALRPFSVEMDRLSVEIAETNCQCPEHRAKREASSNGRG